MNIQLLNSYALFNNKLIKFVIWRVNITHDNTEVNVVRKKVNHIIRMTLSIETPF